MTVNELPNTKITLNPIIKNATVGNTNGEQFAISDIQTEIKKGKSFDWNALIDIVVPEDSASSYKKAEFVEVGRTYCVMVDSQWVKVIVVKILCKFAIVRYNGEEFSVPFTDLYMLS